MVQLNISFHKQMLCIWTQLHVGHPHTFSTLSVSPCSQLRKMVWPQLCCRLLHILVWLDRGKKYWLNVRDFQLACQEPQRRLTPSSLKGISAPRLTSKAELCLWENVLFDSEFTKAFKILLALIASDIVQTGNTRQGLALQSPLI